MKVLDKDLINFLQQHKLLVLSTIDKNGQPWASNVYFSVDKQLNLFFVSPTDTNHSQHLVDNANVAFSIPWFDEHNLANRKAIQGVGVCKRITSPAQAMTFLKNHAQYYPLWKSVITYENMRHKIIQSRPYVIKPSYMKFWNDELYWEEGVKEFRF